MIFEYNIHFFFLIFFEFFFNRDNTDCTLSLKIIKIRSTVLDKHSIKIIFALYFTHDRITHGEFLSSNITSLIGTSFKNT